MLRKVLRLAHAASVVRWRRAELLSLGLAGYLLAGLGAVGGSAPASGPGPQGTDRRTLADGSVLSGRVVEKDGGKPVAGAEVVISWSDATAGWTGPSGETPPPVLGHNTARTDGDGRYKLEIPPERVAGRSIGHLVIRVLHPDFIPRVWDVGGLYRQWSGGKSGGKLIPDTVALERGVEYRAQVVRAGGQPAAGVPYEFSNWVGEGNADLKGRTDAAGRIRLRMPKASGLSLYIPRGADTAPFEKYWGADRHPARPEEAAPADLGLIRLGPGLTITGRVLDLAGKPLARQPLMLTTHYNRGGPRVADTDADGRYHFDLLRPGNYVVRGRGPDDLVVGVPAPRRGPDANRAIRPVDVYLKEGVEPAPVDLHEAETVLIRVRFEGARVELPPGVFAKSAVGGGGSDLFYERVNVFGTLPNSAGVDRPDLRPHVLDFGGPSAKTVINENPRDTRYGLSWGVSGRPDDAGRVVLRAIKGLRHAGFWVQSQGPTRLVYKTRTGPGGPWRDTGGGWLGTLTEDLRAVTVRGFRPGTVVATIRTEGGEPPPADAYAQVDALQDSFIEDVDTSPYLETDERGGPGPDFASFQKGPDGTFRCEGLNPDHEYAFFARATGYVPLRVEHRSVHEGNLAELTLVLRKAAPPPAVGTPAPPFSVKLTDGRPLSLSGLRGKYVLVHFWFPVAVPGLDQIGPVRAVHDRFGKDDRLVMLGLCLAHSPEGAARVMRAQRITWPQAVLRDALNDPIAQDYPQTGAWLIGPDGNVIARDLTGGKIEEAAAGALGAR